jgi:hypothetical protein
MGEGDMPLSFNAVEEIESILHASITRIRTRKVKYLPD